jgi:Zn-dependent M28 family amino/carboxypeptidase
MNYNGPMRTILAIFGCALMAGAQATGPASKAPAGTEGWRAVARQFKGGHVRAHQKFLSGDSLEGRGTGQRGGQVAIDYIAAQFELAGLKPAVNGSYIQPVPLVGVETDRSSTLAVVKDGQEIRPEYLADYVANNEAQTAVSDVDAAMVFVGYGIVAPEYQWDDYKGADLRGKVLLMLVNDPPSDDPKLFGGKALTYYGRWTYKYEEATRRGAAGAVLVHTPQSAGYGWNVVRNSWGREQAYVEVRPGEPALKIASWITEAAARRVAALAGQDLDKLTAAAARRDFRPVDLGVRLRSHLVSKVRPIRTANVIGVLEGSDPKLKDQAVVYTAHHDHLGVGEPVNGDAIYNGAVDNASGMGILLELARAFAAAPLRPRRSIVFAAVTGEEAGLRGSAYYAAHPAVPAARTAVDINYDGLSFLGKTRDAQMPGIERSTLEPIARQAARALNFRIVPEEHPEQGYYYRSDHFSLAKVGIPAFTLDLGSDVIGKPPGWGEKQEAEYRARHYHQPSDEFNPNWDYSAAEQAAAIGIYIGWQAAIAEALPGWKKGDEFEAARLKSLGR